MENNTKNLWTKKFKDMTPEEKKLMRKKIIKIFILAFILMIIIVAILPKDKPANTVEVPPLHEQFETPTLTAEQQKIRNDYIAAMKYLYNELQKIKAKPEFLQYGFAQKIGKEWHDQYKQFDSIKEFSGPEFMTQIIPDIDVLPGDLEILAQSYFSSNPDKSYIENTEKRFQNFINNY